MNLDRELVTELLRLFNNLTRQIDNLEDLIMATQEELATRLTELNTNLSNVIVQIEKVSTEIQNATQKQLDAIADLQAIIDAGNTGDVIPGLKSAMDAVTITSQQLSVAVQGLDNINPDTPV